MLPRFIISGDHGENPIPREWREQREEWPQDFLVLIIAASFSDILCGMLIYNSFREGPAAKFHMTWGKADNTADRVASKALLSRKRQIIVSGQPWPRLTVFHFQCPSWMIHDTCGA